MVSRRLDPASRTAVGLYLRVICGQCAGQGCCLCDEGYRWVSVYAPGRGEQGDDFLDLSKWMSVRIIVRSVDERDAQMEAGHA